MYDNFEMFSGKNVMVWLRIRSASNYHTQVQLHMRGAKRPIIFVFWQTQNEGFERFVLDITVDTQKIISDKEK